MLNARVFICRRRICTSRAAGVTVANSELDVYILHWIRVWRWIARSMDAWDAWLYDYMAQFEWKFKWGSVRGTCRSGGAFELGRRH